MGTLTVAQLSSLSTLQVTVANKNSLAQQLRQTAKVIYRELIGTGKICLQMTAGTTDHDQEESDHSKQVYQIELQHFDQSLNQKNLLIESVNKALDKT